MAATRPGRAENEGKQPRRPGSPEQAHRAVQALSEQGFTVQFVDMGASQPRLMVTRGHQVGLRTSQVIGDGVRFGCEVLLVARGR